METRHYSTDASPFGNRLESWDKVINDVYFPLSVEARKLDRNEFAGQIESRGMGHISVSRLQSTPLIYRRERYHAGLENRDYFLITLPEKSNIHFSQNGKTVVCRPGEFVVEISTDPYVFQYEKSNSMTVVRVPGLLLRDRVQAPENFCAARLSGTSPGGALFNDFLHSMVRNAAGLSEDQQYRYSEQLVDLLAIALETSGSSIASSESSIQQAHLQRIYRYISLHIHDPDLSPRKIAAQCGVSLRYLHLLFKPTGYTVSGWVRKSRLQACYDMLTDPQKPVRSMAELAYRWGFSDQASFNRSFKSHYGMTPREARACAGSDN